MSFSRYLSRHQLHASEYNTIGELIHEPLHDNVALGRGHTGVIRDIVPTVEPPTTSAGDDWDQFYWYLVNAKDANGISLWKKIVDKCGPRPE